MRNFLKSKTFYGASFLVVLWSTFAQEIMINPNADSSVTQRNVDSSSYFFYQRPEYPRDCEEVFQQCSSSQNKSGVYLIKPDGISEPFEVFCDNDVDSRRWMVISRRIDGSLDFKRNWNNYLNGFGFPSTEFWLGNEKLSFLLNQKKYELRIDMVTSGGSSCYMIYDEFRISDEFGGYELVSVGEYSGYTDGCVSLCPTNMKHGDCSCQATCEDPRNEDGCINPCTDEQTCVCPEGFLMRGSDCIPEQECGCFVEGEGVIRDGESYLSSDCSRMCICRSNHLTCEDYACSTDATCRQLEGAYQCQCNAGYNGNGQSCAKGTDCMDLYNAGVTTDGVYTIQPAGWPSPGFQVYCEMESNGGGWTVFQRRVNGTEEFYRNWNSYKDGFGSLTHEFWLGNDKIHKITNQRNYQLRIDAVNSQGTSIYNLYSTFSIGDEANKYRLSFSGKSGNTGGDLLYGSDAEAFSTYDRDNDLSDETNCAEKSRGAWWYFFTSTHFDHERRYCFRWQVDGSYAQCSYGNLNGDYQRGGIRGITFWDRNTRLHCGVKGTEMKVRPR